MKWFLRAAAVAGVVAFPGISAAGNPQFIDFAVQRAHEREFTQCDAAVRDVHGMVDGEDIRVVTFRNGKAPYLRMLTVYGNRGDAIQIDSSYRQLGSTCAYDVAITTVAERSCSVELAALPEFKYETETAGVVTARNAGGVNLVLMPVGATGCSKTFIRDGVK